MITTMFLRQFYRRIVLVFSLGMFSFVCFGQVYSNKVVGKKNEELIDSLKKTEYPYILPIWGKKVTQLGFDLPYSAGISINNLWQESQLVLDNLQIGFNGGQKYNLDEIIRFDEATSEANVLSIRPDVWVLPFLNVYGIFGAAKPSTKVGFGLWVPDSSGTWNQITSYSTEAKFNSTTYGFGMTPTMGVGGGWLALDVNIAWSDVDALDKPVRTVVFGPRLGKAFKLKKPQQTLALWAGGFRVNFSSETNGNIALSEVVPPGGEAQAKIDAGQQKVAETQVQVDTWWNNLSSAQQANPVNKAKYETANRALTTAGNILNAADGALSTISNSTVQYSLDKRLKDMWNFIIGGQFQLNKHWMIRAEYGFLGSRQQFLSGLQYRFGL